MVLFAESWLTELVLVLSLSVVALFAYFSYCYTYWQRKNVPFLKPTFPFGNVYSTFVGSQSIGITITDAYRQLKGKPYGGIYFFNRPSLIILDPDIIRNILVKDFWSFQDRGIQVDESEPLSRHLFLLGGNKWRRLRVKLTPTFTSGKMKMMFQTMSDCGREMVEVLEELSTRQEALEMRELSARYATDVIASVAFGIEVNCQRNPEAVFRQWGRRFFEINSTTRLNSLIQLINPNLLSLLRLKNNATAVSQYFRSMVRETVQYREEKNISRKDFMHLLIQLKNKGCVDTDKGETVSDDNGDNWKLSLDDIAAQAFVFFIAGFETSSTTMSFTLHELAHNPDVQNKLQREIDSVVKETGGQLTYEAICGMHYLDKVVAETLRKYPPVLILNRKCNKEYRMPDSDVVIEEGTPIIIPVYALHHDPEIFPDPERYDPERFSEEQKAKRHPYAYLPFGEGPRICIGMRFGLLQTKVGLTHLLSKFSVTPAEGSKRHLAHHPASFVLKPKDGINLCLHKRE